MVSTVLRARGSSYSLLGSPGISEKLYGVGELERGPVKSSKEKPKKKVREDDTAHKGKRQKGEPSGFLAPIPLSDALTKFLGTGENILPRSDVIKRLWDYIKQNNLQDPADKRNIICDDKLKELFQVNTFNGFTVTKLLAAHFVKTKD